MFTLRFHTYRLEITKAFDFIFLAFKTYPVLQSFALDAFMNGLMVTLVRRKLERRGKVRWWTKSLREGKVIDSASMC